MTKTFVRLLAGASFVGVFACAGSAAADETLTWGYATAQVGNCVQGVTCGQAGGINVLKRETFATSGVEDVGASVYRDDYSNKTPGDYGNAWSYAQAGEGTLGLPVLKAYALGGATGGPAGGGGPFTIAVNVASVQAAQGYTNTGLNALVIPLNAFTGLVDYQIFGPPTNPGMVSAGLAITTSAILDPAVSAQWWATDSTPGHFGQFAADCSTSGALALSNPAPRNSGPTDGTVQYLPVSTASCTGEDTFLLNPGETFYVWARLSVLRSAFGATDASHTFNVTIAPEQAAVIQQLAPSLARSDGANFQVQTDAFVPEPSTWAMMILGFGAAGAVIRRRRAVASA